MEYCEGGSLRDTIVKYGRLDEKLVGHYIQQVLVGLSFLHQQGVIHRDIKSAVFHILHLEYSNNQIWDCKIGRLRDSDKIRYRR